MFSKNHNMTMIIKKSRLFTIIVTLLLLGFSIQSNAQRIELAPFVGYETGGKLFTSIGYLRIGDGMNFGGALDISLAPGVQVELSYSHMKSSLSLDEGFNTEKLSDMTVDYYSIGGLRELNPGEKLVPYGLVSLGLVNYRPVERYSNETLMHASLAGGVKVFASERIGIRVQARLLMPIFFNGIYFSGGTGGVGAGVAGTVGAVQGDFTASLFFVIK